MANPIPDEIRAMVLQRAQHGCERCLRRGLLLHLHHRKQKSIGGKDTPANLVVVCGRCHNRIHEQIPFDDVYGNGWLLRGWEDPQAVPVRMPRGRIRLFDSGDAMRIAS